MKINNMKEQYVKITTDGSKFYYNHRRMSLLDMHRENGPAVKWANGNREWYLYGVPHKQKYRNGKVTWMLNRKTVTKKEHHAFYNRQKKTVTFDGQEFNLKQLSHQRDYHSKRAKQLANLIKTAKGKTT